MSDSHQDGQPNSAQRATGPNVDPYGRQIDYLRIAVTDRCDLRCIYCMPESGVQTMAHADILRFEEIWRIARSARRLGFNKFRVTGGEPLLVRDVDRLLKGLRDAISGAVLSLTTNGVALDKFADVLIAAGVQRLNISLDTLDPDRYRAITRRDCLARVLRGIDRALEVGFHRIKVNAVIIPGINEEDILPLVGLAQKRPIDVRFIEQMPLDSSRSPEFLGADRIHHTIAEHYALTRVPPEDPRQAAQQMFASPDLEGLIGIVAPRSDKFCARCNRLRLTADGRLKGCLLSPGTIDIRESLRKGIEDHDLDAFLRRAIGLKKKEYDGDLIQLGASMRGIGG